MKAFVKRFIRKNAQAYVDAQTGSVEAYGHVRG